MRSLLFILFFATLTATSFGQNLKYKVINKDKVIGHLNCEKSSNGDTTEYVIKSKFKLPMKSSYSYTLECTYVGDVMQFSSVNTYINQKPRSSITTTRNGGSYEIVKDKKTSYRKGQIKYSEALIYYEEPIQHSQLYSDFTSDMKTVTSLNENKYALKNTSNGNKSIYKYIDDTLNKAVIEFGIFNFALVLDE